MQDSEPAGEIMTLTETGPETAAFRGSIDLNETGGAGILRIADGDAIAVTYIDADDGQGGTSVEVTATATVDCSAPAISNVQVVDVHPRDVTITFETDEPANCRVRFGLSCQSLSGMVAESGYKTSHSIKLQNLRDGTTYFFLIEAEEVIDSPQGIKMLNYNR